MQAKWTEIKGNLEQMLDPGIFRIWVGPLSAQVSNSSLQIFAPNQYMCDWIKKRLEPHIREAAARALKLPAGSVELRFGIKEEATSAHVPERSDKVAAGEVTRALQAAQAKLPISNPVLDATAIWHFSFEDFVVGDSNRFAVAAAKELGESGSVQTLFINAAPGLGKTHLTQATGQILAKSGSIKAAYLTAEQFASRYVSCMRDKKLEELKQYLCSLDALVLEDIHFLQRKKAMQEMILSVVKNLQSSGGRVIFTSSFSTKELRDIDGQLLSHFCSGILTGIEKPNAEMRKEILKRKAKSYHINLPDEVCEALSQRISTDIRQLESCLNNMIFKARLLNSGISLELALETANQYAADIPLVDMKAILKLVCESFGITENQLRSKSRRQEYVAGRNTAFYLARKHTELSLEEIGCIFNRKHSTVLRGITQVEEEMARETRQGRQFARTVSIIEKKCGLSV